MRAFWTVVTLVAVGFGAGRMARFGWEWHGAAGLQAEPSPWVETRERLQEVFVRADASGDRAAARAALEAWLAHAPLDREARRQLDALGSRAGTEDQPGEGPAVAAAERAEEEREGVPGHETAERVGQRDGASGRGVTEGVGDDEVLWALYREEGRTLRAAAALRKRGAAAQAETLERIEALLREASSLLLSGKVEAAQQSWEAARALDQSLAAKPDAWSAPVAEMGRSLGAAWQRRASVSLSQGRLRDAARGYERALDAHPARMEAAQGLRLVEMDASRLLDRGARCSELAEILAATPAGSEVSRRAQKAQVGCNDR
jgi:tetratricopeptide (TPR) repeat protein